MPVELTLLAAGDVADYTPAAQLALRDRFARSAGVGPTNVQVQIAAASVRITVSIYTSHVQEAGGVRSSLARLLATPAAASRFLGGIQLANGGEVQVQAVEALSVVAAPNAPPSQLTTLRTPPVAPIATSDALAMGVNANDASGGGIPGWVYASLGAVSALALMLLVVVIVLALMLKKKRRSKTNPSASSTTQGIVLQSTHGTALQPIASETIQGSDQNTRGFGALERYRLANDLREPLPSVRVYEFGSDASSDAKPSNSI